MQTVLPDSFAAAAASSSSSKNNGHTSRNAHNSGAAAAHSGCAHNNGNILSEATIGSEGSRVINNTASTPSEPSERPKIRLEVVTAANVDLEKLSRPKKFFNLYSGDCVGRQFQPEAFQTLAPDQNNLVVISRRHFEVTLTGEVWILKNMSMNPLKVNNRMIPQNKTVEIPNLSKISFLPRANATDMLNPFLEFAVWDMSLPNRIGNRSMLSNPSRLDGISENTTSPMSMPRSNIGDKDMIAPTRLPQSLREAMALEQQQQQQQAEPPLGAHDGGPDAEDQGGSPPHSHVSVPSEQLARPLLQNRALSQEEREVREAPSARALASSSSRNVANHNNNAAAAVSQEEEIGEDRIRNTTRGSINRAITTDLAYDLPSCPCLICCFSRGMDIEALELDKRVLEVKEMSVGRKHQTDYFETLINDNSLLVCISRAHFVLSKEKGLWHVTSTSCNPIYIDGDMIVNGDKRAIHHGSFLSFIPPQETNNDQEPFFMLQARLEDRPLPPRPPQRLGVTTTNRRPSSRGSPRRRNQSNGNNNNYNNNHNNNAPSSVRGLLHRSSGAHGRPSGGSKLSECTYTNMPTFALEVRKAEALQLDALDDMDRIYSSEVGTRSFTVGRYTAGKWFDDLLAVSPSFLVFIARDHMRLRFQPGPNGGSATIESLSKNVIYVGSTELQMNVPVPIRHGAKISFSGPGVDGLVHFLQLRLWINSLPMPTGMGKRPSAQQAHAHARGGGQSHDEAPEQEQHPQDAREDFEIPGSPSHHQDHARHHNTGSQAWDSHPTGAASSTSPPTFGTPVFGHPGTPSVEPPVIPTAQQEDAHREGGTIAMDFGQTQDVLEQNNLLGEQQHGTTPSQALACPSPQFTFGLGVDVETAFSQRQGNNNNHLGEVTLLEELPEEELDSPEGGDTLYEADILYYSEDPPCELEPGEVVLEIRGRAVRSEVQLEKRIIRWKGGQETQMVGRREQLALHRECLLDSYQVYVSREHFRLDRRGEKEIMVTALAINPMYVKKRGEDDHVMFDERGNGIDAGEQIPLNEPILVNDGDELQLFTGQTPLSEWLYWKLWIEG